VTIARAAILAATIAWALSECVRLARPDGWRTARLLWSVGAALACLHTIAALHFNYEWNQAAALEATRRQTLDVTGLDWGGGLYVNYAFVALWLVDAIASWVRPPSYALPSGAYRTVLMLIFLFMFVNSAIVFAKGVGRAVGIVAVLSVLLAWGGAFAAPHGRD
jgi:hypothetical protein